MNREQFTFYRSFWEAAKVMPQKDRLPFLESICAYAFGDETAKMSGRANASFLLVKPILDKASKKAANGKRGGSKSKANGKQTEANPKQTASNIEGEKEKEIEEEIEIEVDVDVEGDDPPTPLNPAVAAVMSAYLDKINPYLSERGRDELAGFVEVMGPDVCLRAIDESLDAKKANWYYIKGILEIKQSQGVRCLADWDEVEHKRRKKPSEKEPWEYDPGSLEGSL